MEGEIVGGKLHLEGFIHLRCRTAKEKCIGTADECGVANAKAEP